MADPKFRRMVSGSLGWEVNINATDCPQYDLRMLISIGPKASGPWTVNNWITLDVNTQNDQLHVTTSSDSSRLNVKVDVLQLSGCLKKESATDCDLCAVTHTNALRDGNCTDSRRRTVVEYWCGCDPNCGGPPPFVGDAAL